MPFINSAVEMNELPQTEKIELQPIQPEYLKVLRIEWMITSVVILLIAACLIFFIPFMRLTYGWMIVSAIALLLVMIPYISMERAFPFIAYAVRDRDVLFRRGWIIRTVKVCPFNRTQNCSVQSGPLERRSGLSTLVIYTAGSVGADMKIPGLLNEDAERIRNFILAKIHKEQDEVV